MNAVIIAVLMQTLVHMTAPTPGAPTEQRHLEAKLFDATRNAQDDVDAALERAQAGNKTVVVVMGANWCHDSIGLAGWFETSRFVPMMRDRYELVYVDVGTPQTGHGLNLDISKRFGIKKVKSTPLVMLVSADGKLLNSKKDAASWRNAASRSEQAVFDYFDGFTPDQK